MSGFKEIVAYQKAFKVAMMVFDLSKKFPLEEKYSLTDQCRRSSRSVAAQFAEAYRKRRYPAHFISKLTDADGENSETQVWLQFAVECGYVKALEIEGIMTLSMEVGQMLGSMIDHPEKWCLPTKKP